MRFLLTFGLFLLGAMALAERIPSEKSAWKCEVLPVRQVSRVQCRSGNQRRMFDTYEQTNASNWFVFGNLLLEKMSDINATSISAIGFQKFNQRIEKRNGGSLIYDISKGEWIASELNKDTLPLAEYDSVGLSFITRASVLANSGLLIRACGEMPGAETCVSGMLSPDGKYMTWFHN